MDPVGREILQHVDVSGAHIAVGPALRDGVAASLLLGFVGLDYVSERTNVLLDHLTRVSKGHAFAARAAKLWLQLGMGGD